MPDDLQMFNFYKADETIGRMSAVSSQLESILGNIERQIQTGLSDWRGEARDYYDSHHATWRAAAAQMRSDLSTATTALDRIKQLKLETEAKNANMYKT
jgi:WXG100 family type VII secretion target